MASETVLIGCKIPNGVVLNLHKTVMVGNMARIERGEEVKLEGYSTRYKEPDFTEGGYALTRVSKDFWDAWFALNSSSDLITSRAILPPHRDANAQAKDHAAVARMFAPLDPTKDFKNGVQSYTNAA